MPHFFSSRIVFSLLAGVAIISVALVLYMRQGGTRKYLATPPLLEKYIEHEVPRPLAKISFSDAMGTSGQISDFHGKVVLLNLWASWCAPCRIEIPQLDALAGQFEADNFVVIALSLDRNSAQGQMFLEQRAIRNIIPRYDPQGEAFRALAVFGLPTSILIDAHGRELGRLIGDALWDSDDARTLIKNTLAHASIPAR